MLSVLMSSTVAAGAAAYAETKFAHMFVASPTNGPLSPLYVATPTILLGVGLFALAHGFKVVAAREKYSELAKKDGEKDVDERYGLPNLYADGISKHARAFNAVQRSHQHIFETYPSAIVGGLLGAYQFPIATAVSTLLYATGRIVLSLSYANCEGDASKRFNSPLARFTFYGLLGNFVLGFASAVKTLMTVQLATS